MKLEDAERLMEQFEELTEMAAPIASALFELNHGYAQAVTADEIVVEDGMLVAKWTEWQRCGNYEEHWLQVPLEYLFDKDWETKVRAEIEAKRKAKLEEEQRQQKIAQEAQEKRERERYLELKAKYGDINVDDE